MRLDPSTVGADAWAQLGDTLKELTEYIESQLAAPCDAAVPPDDDVRPDHVSESR